MQRDLACGRRLEKLLNCVKEVLHHQQSPRWEKPTMTRPNDRRSMTLMYPDKLSSYKPLARSRKTPSAGTSR
jgi:hypothetical protein